MKHIEFDPKVNLSTIVGWILMVLAVGTIWGVTKSELAWQRRDIDDLRIFVVHQSDFNLEQIKLNTKLEATHNAILSLLDDMRSGKTIRSPKDNLNDK